MNYERSSTAIFCLVTFSLPLCPVLTSDASRRVKIAYALVRTDISMRISKPCVLLMLTLMSLVSSEVMFA